MSAISLKSITGITSITTPAGVDNQLTLHNNNTTEAVKLDTAGNLHFHNHLNITGVSTASNFKTGTSNLHNTGLNVQDLDVDGHTNLDNVSIAGVATATTFVGALTGTASGNPTLTSGANNRVVTATGANALTGETGLTYDTQALRLNNTAANPQFHLTSADNGISELKFGDQSDLTRAVILYRSGSAGDALCFNGYNNTERLRITSDGNFLMNGASPNHDASSGSIFIKAPSGDPNRGIKWSDTSDTHYVKYESSVIDGLTINGYSGIAFATGSRTNSTWTERLRLTITGLLHGASDDQGNTTLGGNAGDSFSGTSAIQNTLIGKDAGTAITSGDQHTAVGYNALKTLSSEGGCTAIGAYALEDNTASGNTAVGYQSMKENVSGQSNTAMGFDSLVNNIGNQNVAIGRDAMKASNNASSHDNVVLGAYTAYQAPHIYRNVIIGKSALSETSNTTANHNNVIIGYEAGKRLNYSIGNNVIIGAHAMDGGGTGGGLANQYSISNNVAIGRYALQNAKAVTNNNIVIGQEAGQNAATGSGTYSYWSHNIAIGYRCMRDATGGPDAMVAVGQSALEYHTGDGDGSSGGYTVAFGGGAFRNNRHVRHSVAVGNNAGTDWNPAKGAQHEGGCTFIGGGAGRQHSTGTSNIAIGRDSLNNVVTGTNNTAVGNRCFERITSGSNNCAVTGLYGGLFVSTGDYNNFFGSLAGYAYDTNNATATGDHNNIFGGYSRSSGNNNDHENVYGGGLVGKGANTTYIRGPVYNSNNSSSFSTTSDERIKKNIVDNNTGLDAIEKIRVRNFEYRTKKEITDFDDPASVVVEDKSGVQLGVIAQEIKDILPDVVKQNTTGAYAVNPDNLTWYLVNAVKELSAEVKSLKAQINS